MTAFAIIVGDDVGIAMAVQIARTAPDLAQFDGFVTIMPDHSENRVVSLSKVLEENNDDMHRKIIETGDSVDLLHAANIELRKTKWKRVSTA